MPPARRSNTGAPSSRSSSSTRRLIAGCESCKSRAARVNPPARLMVTKASISPSSIAISIADGRNKINLLDKWPATQYTSEYADASSREVHSQMCHHSHCSAAIESVAHAQQDTSLYVQASLLII